MPELLDAIGQRYGKCPHEMIREDLTAVDIQIDLICMERGKRMENKSVNKNKTSVEVIKR